jgi:hypothetical protein
MKQQIRGHLVGLKHQLRSSLRQVIVDRAIYLVDDTHKTYQYYKRNPNLRDVGREESYWNQQAIEGYTRVFRIGKTKVFRYDDAPSRTARTRTLSQKRLQD